MDARLTVVVMTRDRWPDLRETLPRHPRPVVVVDNGSSDGTPERVGAEFPDVEVVPLGRNVGAPARNVGVQRARTPYVAFADDDSWWEPGALDVAADVLDAHPRVGLVAARMLVGDSDRPDGVTAALAASPLGSEDGLPGPSVLGFLSCGAVVRRDAFLDAGGFDPVVFFMGEEERLALDLEAAGWRLVYDDRVVARHRPATAERDPDERRALIARNRVLTTVMRRPWSVVARTVREEARDRHGRTALRRALPRLPRALACRRVVPAHVEARRRLLDG